MTLSRYRSISRRPRSSSSKSEDGAVSAPEDLVEDDGLFEEEDEEEDVLALVDLEDGLFPNEASTLRAAQDYSYSHDGGGDRLSSSSREFVAKKLKKGGEGGSVGMGSGGGATTTMREAWRPLLSMMRIGNFPGVCLFHVSRVSFIV